MPESPYVFISYASADRARVFPLVERLAAAGVATWFDREGIHGGANYALEITSAIEHAAALALMCSPASLASRNVRQELALGWRFEKPYLPLLLDPVEIPRELAYWLEGSQWIEVLDCPEQVWLAEVARALEPLGITLHLRSDTESPPARERPLLVGRQREQNLLRGQLDRMLRGRGGVVLVGGEAGIGKTTLVEDLSVLAEEAGALVLWGHAFDLSITPPYGPWQEIFRHYQPGSGLPALPPFVGNAEALARVGSQETLFAAICDFFQAVAAARPLVLVLDDLHWADPASLDLFRFLARQVTYQRILLIATYRSEEVTRRHPLFALLPLLVREAGAERIEVRPVDQAAHRAMVESRYALAEPDRSRLERYLTEHAEGNPLYAGELLRTLEEERVLARDGDAWRLGDLEQVRVPALLRQVIEGRLSRLEEESQRLLRVAAVIGHAVPLHLWATVGEVDEETVLELAERTEEARLLEVTPDGDGVEFSHALIREALYESLPQLRRRRLHRQVAEALMAAAQPEPDAVAYHLEQAHDPRAVEWLIRAGERAWSLYAPDAAITHFDLAQSLAERHGQAVPPALYRTRGQAHELVGNFEAARRDFETVLAQARQATDRQAEWQALVDLGMLWAARDYAETGRYFQQALELARAMDTPVLVAHALNRVGNWHVNVGQPLEAIHYHQEALAIFEQLADRAGIAATSDYLGLANSLSGDVLQGAVHYRRAVDLFRATGNREGLASSLTLLSLRGLSYQTDTLVVDQATVAECAAGIEEALKITREIGWRAGEAFAQLMLGFCVAAEGSYRRALDAIQHGITIAEEIDHLQWLAAGYCAAGTTYFDLLALPEARQRLERALAYGRAVASVHWIHANSGFLASVLIAQGDLPAAKALIDPVFEHDALSRTLAQREVWCAQAELLMAQSDPQAALDLLDRMLASSPNVSETQPSLRVSLLRADALMTLHQLDAAERALGAAQRIAEAHDGRPWLWRIHRALAVLFQRQDDDDRARAEFAAAQAIVEQLAAEVPDDAVRQSFLAQATALLSITQGIQPQPN